MAGRLTAIHERQSRRRRLHGVAQRTLSIALAVLLAFGTTPAQLWAEGVEGIADAAGEALAPASEQAGETSDSSSNAPSENAAAQGQQTNGIDAEGAEDSENPSNTEGALPEASGDSNDVESEQSNAAPSSAAASTVSRAPMQAAAASNNELTSNAEVYIQDTKDLGNTYSKISGSVTVGDTLWANMYDGSSSWSLSSVASEAGWEYQWFSSAEKSSDIADYEPIEGAQGQSLVLTDALAGRYIIVKITVDGTDYYAPLSYYGDTIATSDLPGPVRLDGEVIISSASLSTYAVAVGDTLTANAKEKNGYSSVDADPAKLNYQWQSSEQNDGSFKDIPNATTQTYTIPQELEGAYVRCVVSSKIGTSSYPTRATNKIAAQGSLNITNVTLDASGKVNVGEKLTATATAGGEDVTTNDRVTWSWYYGDSSLNTETKIDGADTNTLTVTENLLGKYIEARADGGFGDEVSTAVGPVVEPGAVELYRVEATGDARIGSTVVATAYKDSYSTKVSSSDTVRYQWQYATSNTTSDSAFKDIPGATDARYTIPAEIDGRSARGLYLRVKAVSDGTVVSTYQKSSSSYYPTNKYVDPLGPVALEGEYHLDSVELASSGQGAQVGNTITPSAQVKDGHYTENVPADAKLTYTWYVAGADGSFVELDAEYNPADGVLTLASDLKGKTLMVRASALDNTVESDEFVVVEAGEYELAHVDASPTMQYSSTKLFTGDGLSVSVWARSLDGHDKSVTNDVVIAWYVSDAASGPFEPLEGATGAEITIPASAAGCYLKVVASSGDSSKEVVSANPVIDAGSLAGAVVKLEDERWRPQPVYGTDTNMNDIIEAKLAEMGFEGVTARVTAVEFNSTSPRATVGVSVADDDTNGDITYYFADPDEISPSTGSYTYAVLSSITFELTGADGETASFTPGPTTTIPWDEARVLELLEQKAADVAPEFAEGEAAEGVTQDFTLPADVPGSSYYNVDWSSSDEDILSIEGYWGDRTASVTRTATDRTVTLTASIYIGYPGGPDEDVAYQKTFEVTVLGDPDKIAAEQSDLQKKIDENFTLEALDYIDGSAAGATFDASAVAGDVQLPRPGALEVDGKYYSVAYSVSNDALAANGYRANVYQPLPGARSQQVDVTLTVTSKENPQISASKTLTLTVAPLEAKDIEAELALMEQAKAAYAEAILNGEDAAAVSGNLHAFQKAYLDADGNLAWAYDATTSDLAGSGIVPEELPGYDPMGTAGWRLFRSSVPSVVAHETLQVTQPTYHTEVTVSSVLSSERFARYAERYAQDETWGATFAQLSNQAVSATFIVQGTTGEDDPNPPAALNTTVAFVTAEGETIIPASEFAANEGQTAWDATADVLTRSGYTYQGAGVLLGITAPDGTQWGSTADNWRLFINGEYSNVYASNHFLADGDEVVWVYSADGSSVELPESAVETNPDAEHPALDTQWNGYANGGAGSVTGAATPTDKAEASWSHSVLTDEERAAGASATASDALMIDGKLYVVSGSAVYDTEPPYAATKSLARLEVIDPATGEVEPGRSVQLAGALDSQCRPVYADGIIVVPLAGGALQALSASTLETIWYVDGITGAQSLSSLTVSDGYVYAATADILDGNHVAIAGTIRRVNLYTGAVAGTTSSNAAGYYWAGGVAMNGFYVVGNDAGEILVYTGDLSKLVSSLKLSGGVRSTLVEENGNIYAVSNDGVLHKLTLSEDGTVSEAASVRFGSSSTSTPTIVDGKAYVGGCSFEGYETEWDTTAYYGTLAVIDLSNMTVLHSVDNTAEGKLPADVKSAPLVSTQADGTYVYFTSNSTPGGVYCYKVGDTTASTLFTPDSSMQNYTMASVLVGPDGTLYYTNDAGYLFALKAATGEDPVQPGQPDDPEEPGVPSQPNGGSDTGETAEGGGSGTNAAAAGGSGAAAEGGTESTDEGAVPEARTAEGSAVATALSAEPQEGGVNAWAIVGVIAGILGLAAIGAYLAFAKSREVS